jgi:hypothetical protein
MLGDLLQSWLVDLPAPVTVVSVNNGALLAAREAPGVRIRNSGVLQPDDFERLLARADLLITDNAVSVTIGRAACALLPVALLHNSWRLPEILDAGEPEACQLALALERARFGAVFPFEAFPIWNADDIDELRLFRDNSITDAFAPVELFGGEHSRSQLVALLTQAATRAEVRGQQCRYLERVCALPDAFDALAALLAASTSRNHHAAIDRRPCAH